MTRRSELEMIAIVGVLLILTGTSGESCDKTERQALLDFKAGLYNIWERHGADHLSSWGQESEKRECCEWLGIKCDTKSGHVVRLDLSPATLNDTTLGGNLSSSLVDLRYLTHLDLSHIRFQEPSIPGFLGSVGKLRYLNLSYTGIVGEVPPQLGNLSALEILDLSERPFESVKTISNLGWVSNLLSLESLDLNSNDLSLAKNWVNILSDLPNLSELRLHNSDLPNTGFHSSLPVNASKNLIYLDLSKNYRLSSSSIYPWLFNNSDTLVHLDLSDCNITGSIPESFGDMAALEYLDFTANLLEGSIPETLGNSKAISHLSLKSNKLEGPVPENFGNLSALEYIDLSENLLDGEVPKSIWQLCSLRFFDAQDNSLTGHLRFAESTSECAYFPLAYLHLSWNRIQGPLPNLTLYPLMIKIQLQLNRLDGVVSESLGQLSNLVTLDLSENAIETVLTEAHFLNLFNLRYLYLSSNVHIVLNFSTHWIPSFQLWSISIRSCKMGPHFPRWLRNQKSFIELDMSSSGISDSIPNWFWNLSTSASILDLSNNQISETNQRCIGLNVSYFNFSPLETISYASVDLSSNKLKGSVPLFLLSVSDLLISGNNFSDINSLCTSTTSLSFLDISYNQLSGELPDCWFNAANLQVLVLTHNNISGRIPSSIGFLTRIWALYLSSNKFTGGIPQSLKNSSQLVVLDAGENSLLGQVPAWMGTSFPSLAILSLRSNKFNGSIPSQLCHLKYLHVFDLSSNDLTSSIPSCVGYFEAMKRKESSITIFEEIFLLWKGTVSGFINFQLLRTIDLSSNKLVGEIPQEITTLIGLVALNLSRNVLNGKVPRDIGHLKMLDALDLSNNNLSGSIPSSLGEVDRLNTLDLSNNNLSGKIPTGPQLQNRDFSAYSGNLELCGEPLLKKCDPKDGVISTQDTELDQVGHEDVSEFITVGFYISVALGFSAGFGGTFWSLILKLGKPRRKFQITAS